MHNRSSTQLPSSTQFPTNTKALTRLAIVCFLVMPVLGCNSFGSGKLVQQLQNENERLLTEFRAERQRREDAERLSSTLEARLSESEKLLARQSLGANRVSSLQQNPAVAASPFPASTVGNSANVASPSDSAAESPGFRWQRRSN